MCPYDTQLLYKLTYTCAYDLQLQVLGEVTEDEPFTNPMPGQFRSFDKAGQLKVLAATSPKRIASDPNVPTMQELGYKNVDVTMWRGIAAKKGTPKDQIQAIEAAAAKVATSPSFVAASKKIGFEINYLDSKAFAKKIADDDKQIGKLMKDLGLNK